MSGYARAARQRLASAVDGLSRGAKVAIALAVVVNLSLILAYFWSREGQTTEARLLAQGERYIAYLDGKETGRASFREDPGGSGILVQVENPSGVPSLPEPRGLDRLRVLDAETGEVLLDEDFGDFNADDWTEVTQPYEVKDGVLGFPRGGGILLANQGWRDIDVRATYRNAQGGIISVRVDEIPNRVSYGFRHFRHLDGSLTLFTDGMQAENVPTNRLEPARKETIKSTLAMWLRPYPYVALASIVLVVLAVGVAFLPAFDLSTLRESAAVREGRAWGALGAAAVFAGVAFGATLYFNYSYGSHIPHVPDEVSYIFQARVFASGNLTAPKPPVEESFDFFNPPLIGVFDDRWASVYPFAHSLVLAPGVWFDAIWLIPPVIGAACVVLAFLLGRKIHDDYTGVLAALVMAVSPWFLMTASNFMSHNTAAFYFLLSATMIAYADKKQIVFSIIAGMSFGLLFNTRPLTGLVLMPPFALILLSGFVRREAWPMEVRKVLAFGAGGVLMLLAFMGFNLATTGAPFEVSATQLNVDTVGFGGIHSVTAGIANVQAQFALLVMVAHNWTLNLGVFLVLVPFALGTRNKWDWFLLLCIVGIMAGYIYYYSNGIMHGPRYWYEALPAIALLAASAARRLSSLAAEGAQAIRRQARGSESTLVHGFTSVVAFACVAGLALWGSYDWTAGDGGDWTIDHMPSKASQLKGFNGVTDALVQTMDDADLDNALVLVEPCSAWQCYGTVFWTNEPTLDGNIVYARNLPHRNPALFAAFPDRKVYRATYINPAVVAWSSDFPVPGEEVVPPQAVTTPPTAGEIPSPTPMPTATPDVAAASRRDEQRRGDLARISDALVAYHASSGEYPLAQGIQTFCQYDFDSACVVKEVLNPLPYDPRGAAYQYQSDGQTYFILYASMELPVEPSACPDPIPEHLVTVPNLYCVRGPASASTQ